MNNFQKGFASCLPLSPGVFAYALALGVLSTQKEITIIQLLMMNFGIFAGSSQLLITQMWNPPLQIIAILAAVFAINSRYFLVGASLEPLFEKRKLRDKILYMHLAADENWAITMTAMQKQNITPLYLFGGGLLLFLVWNIATVLGFYIGNFIKDPKIFALDFITTAVFTALAASLWKGKKDLLPWISAAALSISAYYLIPGKWYILIGGFCGALFNALFSNKREDEK